MNLPAWIWVDIDGCGKQWHLATADEDGETIIFPEDGFEDFMENYEDHPSIEIARPVDKPVGEKK